MNKESANLNFWKSLFKFRKAGLRKADMAPRDRILRELSIQTTFSMGHLKARYGYFELRGLTPEQAKLVILIEHQLKVGLGLNDIDSELNI